MKRKIAGIAALLFTVLTVLSGSAVTKAAGYHEYEVEDYIVKGLSAAKIPGVGISIVSDEKEIYSAAFGAGERTEADFVLGSLTKSFTALGIMRMVEDEEVALGDLVTEYLPEYGELSGVTLEQLLHQTSGITSDQKMDDLEITGTPGQFEDAYANYNLLGEVIERVSGETYEEYITENILDANKMMSTYTLRQNPEFQEEVAVSYQNYFGYPVVGEYEYDQNDNWAGVSSGLLLSDVKDMGKYLQMFLKEGDEVVEPESIAAVLENTVSMAGDETAGGIFGTEEEYGMGWISTEVGGEQIYYQNGMLENHMSMMVLMPERKTGVVMLFNAADYMVGKKLTDQICKGVTQILLGQKPEKIRSDTYLMQHGLIDLVMVLVILAAWMPIFMIGIWKKQAKKKFSVLRLSVDILIHLVLPTVAVILVPVILSDWWVLSRFVPDVMFVIVAVIAALYLGAVVKAVISVNLVIRYKMHPEDMEEGTEEETKENEEVQGNVSEEEKKEETETDSIKAETAESSESETEPETSEKKD